MTTPIKLLAVDQMDDRFVRLREAAEEIRRQAPRVGWVKTIRTALGMSVRSLAKRLGNAHASLHELEHNERTGSVTLESLRRVAEALDADLVYAICHLLGLRPVKAAAGVATAPLGSLSQGERDRARTYG